MRLSSGPEFAAFRLRRTDRADRARPGRGWRETNGARRMPAVGCTWQGFPRTPRAECRSRAVAAARRAGPAPRRADPRRDPHAETGEAMARRADVARVVPSEGKLAPQRDGDAQARRDFSPGIGGAPCANPSRPILLHEAYAAGWPLAARLLPGGTSGRAGRRRTSWRRPLPRCCDGRPAPEGADRRICATPTSERFRQSGMRPGQQRGAGAFCRAAWGASASSRGVRAKAGAPDLSPTPGDPSAQGMREDRSPARLRARRKRFGALPRARMGRPAPAAVGGPAAAKGRFRRGMGHRGTAGDPSRAPTACRHAARGVVAFRVVTPLYTLNRIPPFATRSTKPLRKQATFSGSRDGRPNDLRWPPNFARLLRHHPATSPQIFAENARAVLGVPLKSGRSGRARARARAREDAVAGVPADNL